MQKFSNLRCFTKSFSFIFDTDICFVKFFSDLAIFRDPRNSFPQRIWIRSKSPRRVHRVAYVRRGKRKPKEGEKGRSHRLVGTDADGDRGYVCQLGIRTRRYRIPAISPGSVARSTDTFARDVYTGGENDDGYLAQSAHDRSMSPPRFLSPASCSLGMLPLPYAGPPCHPPAPVIPTMLLCAQRATSCHAAAPFFVRPCRRYPDSSPVPLALLPPSRRKRERRRRNERSGRRQWRKRKRRSGKKRREREVPMSRPRRSFCFSPSEISASFHAGVITPRSFFFLSPFRVGYSFLFPFSRTFSLPHATLVSYIESSFAPYARRRGGPAVTSVADFRLECSHLESVFSCTEPVDIFSLETSSLPEFFAVFRRTRNSRFFY